MNRVVLVWRINLDLGIETGLVTGIEIGKTRHPVARYATGGRIHPVGRIARQADELRCLHAVTTQQAGMDAEPLHLPRHRAGLCIHPAVEHHVRLRSLDRGQNGAEVGGIVGGELALDHGGPLAPDRLLELVGQALAIRGPVIDDGHGSGLQHVDGKAAQRDTLLDIVGNQPVSGPESLTGKVGIGRRRRQLGQTGIGIQA